MSRATIPFVAMRFQSARYRLYVNLRERMLARLPIPIFGQYTKGLDERIALKSTVELKRPDLVMLADLPEIIWRQPHRRCSRVTRL